MKYWKKKWKHTMLAWYLLRSQILLCWITHAYIETRCSKRLSRRLNNYLTADLNIPTTFSFLTFWPSRKYVFVGFSRQAFPTNRTKKTLMHVFFHKKCSKNHKKCSEMQSDKISEESLLTNRMYIYIDRSVTVGHSRIIKKIHIVVGFFL